MPTYDRYITRGEYRLYFRHTLIDQQAPTYVLLHGWSGNNTAFVPLERQLNERGINTVIPDLRGHGLSTKIRRRKDYRYPEFVLDVKLLLQTVQPLAPDSPIILLGYSAGGTIALMHELVNPGVATQIILVSANHENPLKYWHIGWFTPVGRALLLTLAKLARFERRKHYQQMDLVKIHGYWGSVFEGLHSMPVDVNLWLLSTYADLALKDLSRVTCPTIILRGENDHFFTAREAQNLQAKISSSQLVTVPNCGHYLVTHHEEDLRKHLDNLVNF